MPLWFRAGRADDGRVTDSGAGVVNEFGVGGSFQRWIENDGHWLGTERDERRDASGEGRVVVQDGSDADEDRVVELAEAVGQLHARGTAQGDLGIAWSADLGVERLGPRERDERFPAARRRCIGRLGSKEVRRVQGPHKLVNLRVHRLFSDSL